MFIDTHCHLSVEDYESIIESLELSKKYDDIFVTIGYHPSEAKIILNSDISDLEKHLIDDKVVGIGEIGLDYHYGKDDIDLQKELFKKQLDLAIKYKLPVVIHSRDATLDTINILKEYPDVIGDIHCFSGSVETARQYINMGYYLGIGGVVTFTNSNLSNVVKEIGIDNIVFETDSPYLTPVPFRGKKNSSKYIPYICKKVAETLGEDEDMVAKKVLDNTYNLFDLK